MIMKVFNDRVSFTDPFRVVFLCGSKFNRYNDTDKRIIIENYILSHYSNISVIILEENFIFKESNLTYLSYDEICMKNLLQIELLVSLYASKIILIHESHSTAAEIGAFSSKKELLPRIAIIAPDKYSVEEDKLGGFLERSFSHQDEKNIGLNGKKHHAFFTSWSNNPHRRLRKLLLSSIELVPTKMEIVSLALVRSIIAFTSDYHLLKD